MSNKLDDLKATIEEYDAAVKEFDNLDNTDWEAIKARYITAKAALPDEGRLVRELLPIALAARELAKVGSAPVYASAVRMEDYQPVTAKALYKLSDDIEALQQALAALEETE